MSNWVISIKLTYMKNKHRENIKTVTSLTVPLMLWTRGWKAFQRTLLWHRPILFQLAYNYLLWPSHWLGFKVLAHREPKSSVYVKSMYEPNRAKWGVCVLFKKCVIRYDLDLQTSYNITAYTLIKGTLWVTYWINRRNNILRRRINLILLWHS